MPSADFLKDIHKPQKNSEESRCLLLLLGTLRIRYYLGLSRDTLVLTSQSDDKVMSNEQLSSIRVRVGHAFGHLKSRWRVLAKRSDIHHSFMPTVVAASCVLHNMCEKQKHVYVAPPPRRGSNERMLEPPPRQPCQDQPNEIAADIRNALAEHVFRVHGQQGNPQL